MIVGRRYYKTLIPQDATAFEARYGGGGPNSYISSCEKWPYSHCERSWTETQATEAADMIDWIVAAYFTEPKHGAYYPATWSLRTIA
jgi:hypothetical protein